MESSNENKMEVSFSNQDIVDKSKASKKKSYKWDSSSGYCETEEEDKSKIPNENPKGWKRPEFSNMISNVSEIRKQMHLTDKCPECGAPNVFKWRNISTDPPSFHITCMNRPPAEKVAQLKKLHGKNVEAYKVAIEKEFCGKTFRIE